MHVIIEESMFLLFEPIYSFRQSSSVNNASHGPLSDVEINSYGNLSKSKNRSETPSIIYINNGTGRELFYSTFYTTTGLKYKKLESERICPCILHWHPASKAFLLAYLRKTHARLLTEYIISNPSITAVCLPQRARL